MQADQIPDLASFEMRLTNLEGAVSSLRMEVDGLDATVSLKANHTDISVAVAEASDWVAAAKREAVAVVAPSTATVQSETRGVVSDGLSPLEQSANDEARHGICETLTSSDGMPVALDAFQLEFVDPERIVAAAIFHGATVALPPPARHHTVLNFMATTMGIDTALIHPVNQGFLTSKGRFVNRTEAFYIADRMGQIIKKTGNQGEPTLFSEDLW